MAEPDTSDTEQWAIQFRAGLEAWNRHLTTDQLNRADQATQHALLLEAIIRSLGMATARMGTEDRVPLLYLMQALQSFMQGRPDRIVSPIKRPANRGTIPGRPEPTILERTVATWAVLGSRMLMDRARFTAKDADQCISEELNRILPASFGRKRKPSTIAGWRTGRLAMLLPEQRSFVASSLAETPKLEPENARAAISKLLKVEIGKLPLATG